MACSELLNVYVCGWWVGWGRGRCCKSFSPMLGIDNLTPPMVAVNVWKHATHHPTSDQSPVHPFRSQAHKVARASMATRSHSMAYKHSLCRVCSTVCGQSLWDPPCLLRWFVHPTQQAVSPPGLHCEPTPRVQRWHGTTCASPHTYTCSRTWSGP